LQAIIKEFLTHRILVVEDNPPSRELLTDWLELEGYDVVAAANLDQAMDAFKHHPPHAVLLDAGRR
jgi:CheY-like chemotaxis protein